MLPDLMPTPWRCGGNSAIGRPASLLRADLRLCRFERTRADAGRLRLYPQRDVLPYERAADDLWDAKARLEVTAALASGVRPVVVAAIEAVAQRTLSPEAARAAFSSVSVGDRLSPDALVRRL